MLFKWHFQTLMQKNNVSSFAQFSILSQLVLRGISVELAVLSDFFSIFIFIFVILPLVPYFFLEGMPASSVLSVISSGWCARQEKKKQVSSPAHTCQSSSNYFPI